MSDVPTMFTTPAGKPGGLPTPEFGVHSLQGPEGTEIKSTGGSTWRSNPQNWDDAPPCA